jgi:hypothetical protein
MIRSMSNSRYRSTDIVITTGLLSFGGLGAAKTNDGRGTAPNHQNQQTPGRWGQGRFAGPATQKAAHRRFDAPVILA